ncbi:hypothetical protein BDW59DRAFT_149635 [Aspergillus cavernicola]|uniref:Uncharacterized protein n=1 Tax=Aspergillus cavernicola TaxID=176166 RepID=A0ABR4I3R5_9EURO
MATARNPPKRKSHLLSAWRYLRRPYHWATRRSRLLLRAIGLGILAIVHGDESPKILVYKSRRAVLFRSAVHILPACVSLILITLNLHGYFIGRELQGYSGTDDGKLGALQVAAKIQELLILASVAAVILHVLRLKLICKEGLPLGLLGADRSFTQISFFWSLEFWGAVLSYNSRRWRQNYIVVGLLILAGVLATLAGPSTAVLMIPRKLDWPVGGGIFWLNGSESELWPTNLDAEYLQDYICLTDEARLHDFRCPSAGYLPLFSHLSTWWNFPDALHEVQLQDSSIRKVFYVASNIQRIKDTWTYTTSGPSANLQDATVNFYRNGLLHLRTFNNDEPPYPLSLELAESKKFKLKTQVPAVRVSCLEHRPLSLDDTALPITFPKLDQFALYRTGNEAGVIIDVADAVRDYLSARGLVATNDSEVSLVSQAPQLLTIPLNITAGDASSLGLLILKQLGGEGKNMAPLTCTVDARWAKATSIIEASPNGDLLGHDYVRDQTRNVVKTELKSSSYIQTGLNQFHPEDKGSWKHIRIQPDWFDLLSPRVSNASLFNTSTLNPDYLRQENAPDPTLLERLLGLYDLPTADEQNPYITGLRIVAMEVAISMFFTDGLSRCGAHRHRETWRLFPAWDYNHWFETTEQQARTMVRKGDPVETYPMPEVLEGRGATRMVMRAKFFGYALTPMNWFDYLSIALLLTHILLAAVHTIWSLWRGETSEAWDTIPELVALSQQSPPAHTPLLDNTCAGARSMRTMRRVVRVETAAKITGGVAKEALHLTFRESWQERKQDSIPGVEAAYGNGPGP